MIGFLFGVNIVLALGVGLTTAMLQNHFNKIKNSLSIYANPKAYKPESNIAFISNLIEYFKSTAECDDELLDIQSIIYDRFTEEKIGAFPYLVVQAIAIKGKFIIWGVLAIQIMIEFMSTHPGESITDFIYIVSSTLICMVVTLADVIKSIHEQRMQLIENVQNYILEIYPNELAKRRKNKAYQELLEKLDRIESEQGGLFQKEQEEEEVHWLAENDIKAFLQEMDKEA